MRCRPNSRRPPARQAGFTLIELLVVVGIIATLALLALASDNAAAGLPPADKIVSNYVSGVAVSEGAIHITFGNRAGSAIAGKRLSLRPARQDAGLRPEPDRRARGPAAARVPGVEAVSRRWLDLRRRGPRAHALSCALSAAENDP